MSKASKHAHTQPFMRASERAELGAHYGTTSVRLNKDSQRAWNACCVTLVELGPRDEAVATPAGHLYSREALLQSMATQKARYRTQLAAWREHQSRDKAEQKDRDRKRERQDEQRFAEEADGVSQKKARPEGQGGEAGGRAATADYFRAGRKGVEAAAPEKPRKGAVCPASGEKVRLEELQRVLMAPACASCRGVFAAAARVAVLTPSGTLVCEECVTAGGAAVTHPATGEPCGVLRLKRGGTGFAANTDETLVAVKKREGFQLG